MQYFEEYIEEYFEHEDRLWTREVAVPRLLRVVQVLSLVTSPLEADAYSGIIRTLEAAHDRLWAPGCSVSLA